MAGKKSRTSRVSMGGRQKANVKQESKRQAKFAAKREAGTQYVYTKNPYDKKNDYLNWHDEDCKRKEKTKSSKLPYARLQSIFAKLDNEIKKDIEKKKAMADGKKGKRSKGKQVDGVATA